MLRFRSLAVVAAATLAVACQANQANQPMSDAVRSQVAGEIQAAADTMMAGLNRLDVEPYVGQLADIRVYAENTMMYPDADSLVRTIRTLPAAFRAFKVEATADPVIVVLTPDIGVYSVRYQQAMTDGSGATATVGGVWTAVYQRQNGAWKIVAAHESYAPSGAPEGT